MAQVRRKNPAATGRAGRLVQTFMALARERVELPPVVMHFNYQGDVDTLVIRFEEAVSPSVIHTNFEEGVIGIYQGKKLVGVELLDITGGLEHANPR
ncbi:MAG TPA: hypothetical protein VJ866_17585 [Pyrinomonadaceae bacterium]|nr:hypothetical protein [Pyrinomonadaceae bacterium]